MRIVSARVRVFLGVLVITALAGVSVYGSGSAEVAMSGETEALLTSLSIQPVRGMQAAPAFEVPTLDGDTITVDSFRGQYVFLNFWATWCGPCVHEMPAMQELHDSMDGRMVVVAMNSRENEDLIAPFIETRGFDYPVGIDPSGRVTSAYGVRGLPTTYIIDPIGRLVGVKIGAHTWADESVIEGFAELVELSAEEL